MLFFVVIPLVFAIAGERRGALGELRDLGPARRATFTLFLHEHGDCGDPRPRHEEHPAARATGSSEETSARLIQEYSGQAEPARSEECRASGDDAGDRRRDVMPRNLFGAFVGNQRKHARRRAAADRFAILVGAGRSNCRESGAHAVPGSSRRSNELMNRHRSLRAEPPPYADDCE